MGESTTGVRDTIYKRLKAVPPVRLIVISFAVIIFTGALLLMLPVSSRDGAPTNFLDSLFISTSATCVTGLTVFDTWTKWTEFGQVIIILLIQAGGLGLITFTTGFTLFLRRKLGLKDLQLASENTSGAIMDVPRLIKMILKFTFSVEAIGALLLMLRFVPKYGFYGVWISVFTSISGFCNAGFDILGFEGPYVSLVNYAGDPLVSLTVAFLIIIGGLGFVVVSDLYNKKIRKPRGDESKHLNLHTTVVLKATIALLVSGTVLFMALEYNNTLGGLNFFQKLLASFFQSTSARTAGFASVNIGAEHDVTKLLTVILMFIGASPASTGGGIKTTTFAVLIATVISVMRGSEDTVISKRKIDKSIVYRSLAITFLAFLVTIVTTGVISVAQTGKFDVTTIDALFEAVSGFGTVGLTAGITPILASASKISLILAMFIGRVGPVSLALAITIRHGRRAQSILPTGRIIVG